MDTTGYQVIARRWRPKQFSELVGQEHIVRTLMNAINQNRIAHAYLFVGQEAQERPQRLVCLLRPSMPSGPSIEPDNESEISKAIISGSCMDVVEIDGASNNSVEDVRSLREDCQYAPTQGNFKIYIIDEVHMLSQAAFNALLKTLEEPPSHVKFIFATTEAHKVLPTIVSRCQRLEFRPVPEETIVAKLKVISEGEGITATDEALHAITRLANGGMRDSQSILDQMISFCGSEIAQQDVLDVYGLASPEKIEAIFNSMVGLDFSGIVAAIDALIGDGRDLVRVPGPDLESKVRATLLEAIRSGAKLKLMAFHFLQNP